MPRIKITVMKRVAHMELLDEHLNRDGFSPWLGQLTPLPPCATTGCVQCRPGSNGSRSEVIR